MSAKLDSKQLTFLSKLMQENKKLRNESIKKDQIIAKLVGHRIPTQPDQDKNTIKSSRPSTQRSHVRIKTLIEMLPAGF